MMSNSSAQGYNSQSSLLATKIGIIFPARSSNLVCFRPPLVPLWCISQAQNGNPPISIVCVNVRMLYICCSSVSSCVSSARIWLLSVEHQALIISHFGPAGASGTVVTMSTAVSNLKLRRTMTPYLATPPVPRKLIEYGTFWRAPTKFPKTTSCIDRWNKSAPVFVS
ncbi:hypothetical protein BGY98DRAFT_947752 [Russula aff. rugulosa BPL654]|nr:hypothetical protein BGY98DRAFT_947752 [Russula aff. rugulosa BPL654]